MKIYGIRDKLYNYNIEEFDVEKETENQYVIIRTNDKNWFFNGKYTIRKKDMKNSWFHFVLTYEEAVKWKKEFIKNEIKSNKTRIKNLEDRNVDLNNWLDALEN